MIAGPAGVDSFLSTLSLRRATMYPGWQEDAFWISIHALLAESDANFSRLLQHVQHFYPRSPCGERRADIRDKAIISTISIHALLAESDLRLTPSIRLK